MDKRSERKQDFAFETTPSAHTYAPWLGRLRQAGYNVLLYWLRSAEVDITRVAQRVRSGGHLVPDEDVRRRYARSVGNFLELYRPISHEWEVYGHTNGTRIMLGIGVPDETEVESDELGGQFLWSAET